MKRIHRSALAVSVFCTLLPAAYGAVQGAPIQLLQLTNDPPAGELPDRHAAGVDFSGSRGDSFVRVPIGMGVQLPNPPEYYAINKIQVVESDNNPCFIRLLGRMVDPAYSSDDRIVAQFTLGKCSGVVMYPEGSKIPEIGYGRAEQKFIRAVQVCGGKGLHQHHSDETPWSHWEIKGLRALPGRVSKNGEVTAGEDRKQFMQPNCPDHPARVEDGPGWSKWQMCPPGRLAAGVIMYTSKGKRFTGMELDCRFVRKLDGAVPVKVKEEY